MDTKHTPGPWVKDRHEQLRGSNGEQVGVWGAGISWASRSDVAEANARLIAAAPDLLSALEDLMEAIGNHTSEWAWEERKNAISAIAKATQP